MAIQKTLIIAFILTLTALGAGALNTDDELWIAAAGRGPGVGPAFWITDLYIMNPGDDAVTVEVGWLVRGRDNSDHVAGTYEVGPSATLVLPDVVLDVFGLDRSWGAIHVEIVEDDEDDGDAKQDDSEDAQLVVTARVYTRGDDEGTFGLSVAGVPSDAAIAADGPEITHSAGVTDDDSYRSNWYGVNIADEQAELMVEVLDQNGQVLATDEFSLPPYAPILETVSDLGGPDFGAGTVRFTMLEGEGIFGVTKIDNRSHDSINLESHWKCADGDDEDFTTNFLIDDCTFATTGRNPYWIPLVPGFKALLEGEEDGEETSVEITVLEETHVVDGVETRVVQEYETVDGELVEISRNYFALCTETGSVFYFGEDVDIYEEGEVVSHDGAWLAGIDGAEAGLIMPGTVLLGSRYYQEIAPGVALDRAEHVAMDATVETEAGAFSDCLEIWETTPLEEDELSIKLYAPGVGLVFDDGVELVEFTDPGDS